MRLQGENFRSYREIDVTIPSGLTLVNAVNRDEDGGSNSGGKSTIGDLWFWVRYGWLPRWKGSKPVGVSVDSVIHRGQKSCRGVVTEWIGNDEIVIERRRPNKLIVHVNGEQKHWNQAELEKFLGMDAERCLACCYLAQRGARQSFLSLGEQQRMALLSVVSGQGDAERAFKAAKAKQETAQKAVDRHSGAVAALEAQVALLPNTDSIVNEIVGLEKDIAPNEVALAETLKTAELAFEAADAKMRKSMEDYEARFVARIAEIGEAEKQASDELKEISASIRLLSFASSDTIKPFKEAVVEAQRAIDVANAKNLVARNLRAHAMKLQTKIEQHLADAESSLNGKCLSCKRDLPEEQRQAEAARHIDAVELLQKELDQIDPQEIDLSGLLAAKTASDVALATKNAEIAAAPRELESKKKQLEFKLHGLASERRALSSERSAHFAALMQARDESVNGVMRVAKEIEAKLAGINDKLTRARESLASAQANALRLQNSLVETNGELAVSRTQLDEALDLIDLFGPKGWPSVKFEGLVQRISDRAGELFSKMTRGVYSTRLEQSAVDGSGNHKSILRPVILKGGMEVSADDPSGGKESAVWLAYDIALAESTGGSMPLFLDESLEGMDVASKMCAMEMLQEVSQGRPVLVIDHASEFKEMFNENITVVMEGGVSRIVQ